MLDGMPAVGLSQYLAQESFQKVSLSSTTLSDNDNSKRRPPITNIFANATAQLTPTKKDRLQDMINNAKSKFVTLVNDHDLHVETFRGYGSTFMKRVVQCSPDAYVQMAIQLATFRLFGKQVATYESTQVRPFLHGRTETTRSVSKQSAAFVNAMAHPQQGCSIETKQVLLRDAMQQHVAYLKNASQGQGVDRHFFGLQMLLQPQEESPRLFEHALFHRSKRWRVSTSTLPGVTPGFGPVVWDGVGIGYDVQPYHCVFTVTARKEHGYTERLCHHLEEAMLEMQTLMMTDTDTNIPKSKL